ncbi:MAG: metalloregulator ArsR/SmtB family transcription factor [Pseudomonadota bacterium]
MALNCLLLDMMTPLPVGHDQLVTILKAAGETTRLRILALLAEADLTVKDFTTILGQSQPRISRHLKLLAEAGLVTRTAEGTWAYYRLSEDSFGNRMADIVLSHLDNTDLICRRDSARAAQTKSAHAAAAARYFSTHAEEWDRIRSLHAPEADVEAAILDILGDRPVQSLLDVGTGTGRMLELLAPHCVRMMGVDASAAMLSVARANLIAAGVTHARIAQEDIYALSQPSNAFDVVLIHQVLHFLDDPARALTEASRTLRPGGRLLVVDFAPHDQEALRLEAQHRRLGIAKTEMAEWLDAAGLDVESANDIGGQATTLTVTLWLARDRRLQTDDLRPEGSVIA